MNSNRKHIAVVTRKMVRHGAERVIAQLANYFVNHGIDCTVICMYEDDCQCYLDSRVNLITVGKRADNKVADRIKRYIALRRLVMDLKVDVVLSMPETIGIYVLLALIGTGIPVYVSERNNPWVMPDVKITRALRVLAYPFAKGIIFQTEMARSFFGKRIQKKSIVLQNPIEEKRIPQQYQGKRRKKIVAVGRLHKQKNFSFLIQAYAMFRRGHPEYELQIYGEGEQKEALENEIRELELTDCVFLKGSCEDVLSRINDASMFVLSSDYEGMPNVLIEAMCMGMPVIATDCPSGGPRSLITDGKNGLLVPVADKTAMVHAMERMTNEEYAQKLADNAYLLRKALTSQVIFEEWRDYLVLGTVSK